eukprot:1189620-Prorocentrum_minimum.AAC.2
MMCAEWFTSVDSRRLPTVHVDGAEPELAVVLPVLEASHVELGVGHQHLQNHPPQGSNQGPTDVNSSYESVSVYTRGETTRRRDEIRALLM